MGTNGRHRRARAGSGRELTEFDASLLEGLGEVFQFFEVGSVISRGLERARFVRVRV